MEEDILVAIAVHTVGALGKLFSEVNENADLKPVEGLTSVGASWSRLAATNQIRPTPTNAAPIIDPRAKGAKLMASRLDVDMVFLRSSIKFPRGCPAWAGFSSS